MKLLQTMHRHLQVQEKVEKCFQLKTKTDLKNTCLILVPLRLMINVQRPHYCETESRHSVT